MRSAACTTRARSTARLNACNGRRTRRRGPEAPRGMTGARGGRGPATARVWFLGPAAPAAIEEAFLTDLEWQSDSVLVVARQPGADFLRLQVGPHDEALHTPLRARGYDGL